MKTYYNLIFAFVIFAAVNSIMLMAGIFIAQAADSGEAAAISLNFLIAALPAGLLAFLLSKSMKTAGRRAALIQSAIWTVVQLVLFALIGRANQTIGSIFGGLGFYIMLLFVFAGPLCQYLARSAGQKKVK